MSEDQAEYITDAIEMMGTGYSVEIEPPRRKMGRNMGEAFVEYTTPAWVKFSTAFKMELPNIDGNALKVWIYIALSVNYKGEAFPAITTIAKAIGLSHTTVISHIKALEGIGLLTVRRGEKRFNIYEITNDYVKVGAGEPVKKLDSSALTSKENGLISKENEPMSQVPLTVTRVNKIKQEKSILTSKEQDLVDGYVKYQIQPTTIRTAVHEYFRLNTNWDTKTGREWLEWAVGADVTPEQLKRAADTWRNDKAFNWQTPTLRGIFEKWQMLMDASPVVEKHRVYRAEDDEVIAAVPAPERMR